MANPTLLLLHGLGATAGVWHEVLDEIEWPGKVLAPDLAGHGAADWSGDYTVGGLAAAAAGHCEAGEPVVAVGHSLGGGVALCLASGFFRPQPVGVVAIGVKTAWTDADVAGMAAVAGKGVRWCETRDEAVARFLRNAGLVGVVEPDHPAVAEAVVQGDRGWRVAQDPATFAQRKLDMAGLVAAARCPVILGAGAEDGLVSEDDLAVHTPTPRIAAGSGHNVQVTDPTWVIGLVQELVAEISG